VTLDRRAIGSFALPGVVEVIGCSKTLWIIAECATEFVERDRRAFVVVHHSFVPREYRKVSPLFDVDFAIGQVEGKSHKRDADREVEEIERAANR
jgi:hypothetical protein